MRITAVEAIVLRQPAVDDAIADGSQDDLVIKVHTDEGIVGIGEVDSAPEAVSALVQRRSSHAIAGSLHDLLVGEDPRDVERLWQKMYRGLIYIGRRGIALHALSGIDIALWDIAGKAAGKPVCELIGKPQRDKVRAYASMLMPPPLAKERPLAMVRLAKSTVIEPVGALTLKTRVALAPLIVTRDRFAGPVMMSGSVINRDRI